MKILKIITALTILFVFAFSLSASARTLYAPDGRTAEVSEQDVQRWESVGWYSYPVATLYALDGRTVAVRTSDVPAWKSVGWYEMPVTEVFASDGRTMVIASSELETYKNVGWFENYIATLYSIDGRTINVYAKDVPAYKNVGWYDRNEYYMAMADKYASEYGYRSAVEYLEGLFDDGKYTDALGDKKVEFCSAWMKEIGCPIVILESWVDQDNYYPTVNLLVRNLAGVKITNFELEWTCYDAYGDVATEHPSLYDGTWYGWINNIDLPAWGCGEYYWTLSSNERKTARISYPAVQKIAFADWSVWLR